MAVSFRSPALFRMLLVIAIIVAFVLALLPHPPHLPIDTLGDKFEHSLAFSIVTFLAVLAFPEVPLWRIGERLSFLGALIEVFQSIPMVHRDCDVLDWLTDNAAIAIALLIVVALRGNGRRRLEA